MIENIILTVSAFVGVIAFLWEIKKHQDQRNAELFLEFTRRFDEVMQTFPKNTWAARLNIEGTPPPKSKALSQSTLRYLNLCSEEFYLCKRGWLSKEIWKIWEAELVRTLQSDLFIREWKDLHQEFESYPEFKEYVDEKQKKVQAEHKSTKVQPKVDTSLSSLESNASQLL